MTNTIAGPAYVGEDGGLLAKQVKTGIITVSGTTHTLELDDSWKLLKCTSNDPTTVTVPPESSVEFPIGTKVGVSQWGDGVITVAEGVAVDVRSEGDAYKVAGKYGGALLQKVDSDEWLLEGNLTDE